MNNNFTEMEVYQVYKSLGVDISQATPGDNGFVTVKAGYRQDKNPSLGVHIQTGNFKDHGTGENGNIFSFVMTVLGCDFGQAKSHVSQIIGRDPFSTPTSTGTVSYSQKTASTSQLAFFWDSEENLEKKKEAAKKLRSNPSHSVINDLQNYDQIEFKTLERYQCGILKYQGFNYALLPHQHGAQLYRRDQSNKKVIRNLPGTDTKSGFFGLKQVKGTSSLHILKSPRETMLASQITDDDVIGLTGGETDHLPQNQLDKIRSLTDAGTSKVYTYLDCDDDGARKIAKNFALNITTQLDDPNVDVYYVNIFEISKGTAKDLTDWKQAGNEFDELQSKASSILPMVKFWETKSNGKVRIRHPKLIKQLGNQGFMKIYFNNEPIPILKRSGVISRTNQSLLIDSVKDMIKDLPELYCEAANPDIFRENLMEAFYDRHTKFTSDSNQLLLDKGEVTFFTDTKDAIFLPYKNGILKIDKNDVDEVSYDEIEGVIWEDQIVNRNFKRDSHIGSDSYFAQFLRKVADGSKERYEALITSIGYLLSTHKDKANAKAVIFVDEKIVLDDQDAQGRTGKSLVTKALRHIRNTHIQPGKNYNPGHQFAYQNLDIGHQIFVIDDVRGGFDFEGIFNTITDDLIIEDKYESPVIVPFEISPKIVVTTNTAITGTGPSYEGRQNVVEFSNFFSNSHDIRAEFGHTFFDDWDDEEWLRFDNFMVDCAQSFLKHGLKSYAKNYKRKQLLLSVEPDVIEFYETQFLIGKEYDKKSLFEDFQLHSQNSKYKFSQASFTTQLKKCGDFDVNRVVEIAERKSGRHRYIRFIPTKEYEEEARKKIDMEPDIFGGADF